MIQQDRVEMLLTCEHGGNQIPAAFAKIFERSKGILKTHAGWDIGALVLAKNLESLLQVPLYFSKTSRLVVDLNRSLHHPRLFSEVTKTLPQSEREKILARHYFPYRDAVASHIAKFARRGRLVLHLSIHSFTPRLAAQDRLCEFGLLYDPGREIERDICLVLKNTLKQEFPNLRTRLNYPYRGTSDGLTTHLRRLHPDARYAGIEIEVNQSLLTLVRSSVSTLKIAKTIATGLSRSLMQ